MKILSLTEDQFQLLKSQYEDELELALKYVDDIRSILFKLNKQEGKLVTEKKPRKKRKSRKTNAVKSAGTSVEIEKKAPLKGKKRGRKPKKDNAVSAKAAPVKKARKAQAAPKKVAKKGKTKRAQVQKPVAPKSKPVVKKKSSAPKARPGLAAKVTDAKNPVKTYISPEVKKDE